MFVYSRPKEKKQKFFGEQEKKTWEYAKYVP